MLQEQKRPRSSERETNYFFFQLLSVWVERGRLILGAFSTERDEALLLYQVYLPCVVRWPESSQRVIIAQLSMHEGALAEATLPVISYAGTGCEKKGVNRDWGIVLRSI